MPLVLEICHCLFKFAEAPIHGAALGLWKDSGLGHLINLGIVKALGTLGDGLDTVRVVTQIQVCWDQGCNGTVC